MNAGAKGLSLCGAAAMLLGLAACGANIVVTQPPSAPERTASTQVETQATLPVDPNITPVSKSHPDADAANAFAKCQIGVALPVSTGQVSGMGRLASAERLLDYVPLTGREPELNATGPIWIIQVTGDIPQRGGEVWTDPTCVVTSSRSGWYATGPVTLSTGNVVLPEPPAVPPRLALPSPAP